MVYVVFCMYVKFRNKRKKVKNSIVFLGCRMVLGNDKYSGLGSLEWNLEGIIIMVIIINNNSNSNNYDSYYRLVC